jgi:hypothetical protein
MAGTMVDRPRRVKGDLHPAADAFSLRLTLHCRGYPATLSQGFRPSERPRCRARAAVRSRNYRSNQAFGASPRLINEVATDFTVASRADGFVEVRGWL